MMIMNIIYVISHFLISFLFFLLVQRPLFCAYNRRCCSVPVDWRKIFAKGYRTDIKAAGYLTILPALIVWSHLHFPAFDCRWILMVVESLLALAVGMLTVADIALYRFWQFKIDVSVFAYLKSPKEAFASVSAGYMVVALVAIVIVSAVYWLMGYSLIYLFYDEARAFSYSPVAGGWLYHSLVLFLFALVSFCVYLTTRGLKHHPENPSIAYFSKNSFFNHAALNPLFNFIYSASVKEDFGKQFQTLDRKRCAELFKPSFPIHGIPMVKLLKTHRPHIVLVIWEGLCTRFVETLGGMPQVAVNFDRLSKEGVLFTQCYAGSYRTERGLVCLLSGYPGQPTTNLIRHTRKLVHIPAFPRVLRDSAGYLTMAVHGGDLSFLHKADYYLASGHDRLVQQKDFPSEVPSNRWGIHDDYMFSWLYDELLRKTNQSEPWYVTFQTLSSHEPFEVPYHRIKGDKVANSFAYTDHCFGTFVDKLKQTRLWDNLLIICTGDHGVNIDTLFEPGEKSHIPLLLLGGAVEKPMRVDTIVGQTDLASTLLGQLEIPHEEFIFSRDVLADTYLHPSAFHAYNNGFIFRDSSGYTAYDTMANVAIEGEDRQREELGKAILQTLYADLSKR